MMAKDFSSDTLFHSNTDCLAVLFKYFISIFHQQNCKFHDDTMSYTYFLYHIWKHMFFSFTDFGRWLKVSLLLWNTQLNSIFCPPTDHVTELWTNECELKLSTPFLSQAHKSLPHTVLHSSPPPTFQLSKQNLKFWKRTEL